MDTNKEKFAFLASLGVIKIVATFDGGGDSGQVNDISVEGLAEDKWRALKPAELDGGTLEKFVDDLIDQLLEQTNYDWYNNDGGYGEIIITPGADEPLHIDMNIRITASQLYEFKGDEDGDPVMFQEHEVSVEY